MTAIVVLVFSGAAFLSYQWYSTYEELTLKESELNLVSSYDTSLLTQEKATRERFLNWTTLDDIILTNENMAQEKKRYDDYFASLQNPYNQLLQYIYLPSLNIWKNVYTNEVDTSLVGENFLEKNPYTDLYLITKRSNFFKDIGDTAQFNEITDVSIKPIQEMESGFFKIPISLSFTSPNKRSFLLLVDKLSMTSNKDNIALINEFLYYVWEEIKKSKSDYIERQVYDEGAMSEVQEINRKLGYLLHESLRGNLLLDEPLITDEIIDEAIKKAAGCKNESVEKCYYLFREKYRTIPYLAYTIADRGVDKTESLQVFLQELPPIIKINEFTFNEARSLGLKTDETSSYQGKISIDVFGRGVPDEDVQGVSTVLGKECFEDHHAISVTDAINQVNQDLAGLSEIDSLNLTKSKELTELKSLFENMQKSYDKLSNYKKIVKLFEIYRMLDDANVCNI